MLKYKLQEEKEHLTSAQSVEYTDNNKETVTFMENYELFQSLEAPLLHLNLFLLNRK